MEERPRCHLEPPKTLLLGYALSHVHCELFPVFPQQNTLEAITQQTFFTQEVRPLARHPHRSSCQSESQRPHCGSGETGSGISQYLQQVRLQGEDCESVYVGEM